ncbi:MAG: N-acetylmuramoyl-L-alanine amidase [Candidatus Goldbacteria bacterium]|nr:N-acetylmuramoyl-L-alanine amidase [Candidatus Goldiibacteriota bacterium]
MRLLKNNFKKFFFIYFSIFFSVYIFALNSDFFVNIRYLEKEVKAKLDYNWTEDKILIVKNSKIINIFLNIPYIISDNYQKKIDIPPFSENGNIYISQYTFDEIVKIFDKEIKKQSEIKVQESVKQQQEKIVKQEIWEDRIKETEKIGGQLVKETSVLKKEITPTMTPVNIVSNKKQTRILVLDPGHGGTDPGAIGANGVREKDIVLDITLRIIRYLKDENFKIYLTRDDDTFISLKHRALFANEKEADLFISIHCNASKDREAQGVRTYIYNRVASSREAAEAAKLENKDVGVFEMLLNDLRKSAYEYLSIEAAGNIQHCLVKNLRLKWAPTERAPFYVLANTNMPSVLVEAAFISNPQEEKKLDDNDFREKVAKGIAEGIKEYFSKLK